MDVSSISFVAVTTVVLLGAGASKEADVPTTTEMTQLMVEQIADEYDARYSGTAAALNFVIGAMIAHDTMSGASPYAGLDVERVFSAVELLATRDELEVAPFVASWHPAVDAAGGDRVRFPAFFARNFREALGFNFDTRLESAFIAGVRAVIGSRSNVVYTRLMGQLTLALRKLVHIADPTVTRYLSPLFDLADRQDGNLTIATLNYDRSVELCAAQIGRDDVSTGIEDWITSGRFARTGGVRLLKLHGSIEWCQARKGNRDGQLSQTLLEVSEDEQPDKAPAVVFGQRGKLRAEGPFLDLLAEFDHALATADHLLVIGYSFRDEHVNEYIRRWVNVEMSHKITVIDPGFPTPQPYPSKDMRIELQRSLIAHEQMPDRWPTRLQIDRYPASQALPGVVADDWCA
jgi:hypothetical protein